MQHPFSSGLIMLNAYPYKINLYSIPENQVVTHLVLCVMTCVPIAWIALLLAFTHPTRYPFKLYCKTQTSFVFNDDLTCISLTVHTKVAS